MISPDAMTTLIPAATAKTEASSALDDQLEGSIAYAINNAVNTGEYSVQINQPISSTLMTKLTGSGYKYVVEPVKDAIYGCALPNQYIIRWD